MGSRLLEVRRRLGLTQELVARSLSISVREYRAWEKDLWEPSDREMDRLARVLHVSQEYLRGERTPELEREIDRRCRINRLSCELTADGQLRAIVYIMDILGNPKYNRCGVTA